MWSASGRSCRMKRTRLSRRCWPPLMPRGQLDHRTDEVGDRLAHRAQHLLADILDDPALMVELRARADERNHDLGLNVESAALGPHSRLEDGARLHLGDLRIRDAEPAAAMAEHGIGFAQRFHDLRERNTAETELSREQLALFAAVWQEFVQGRVEQANRDRTAAHCLEDSFKIRTLKRQQILKCAPAAA